MSKKKKKVTKEKFAPGLDQHFRYYHWIFWLCGQWL